MKLALRIALALLPALTMAQEIGSFSDQDYERILKAESRVLFYSVSPSMPLSVEGMKEIRHAASALRATLIVLADPSADPKDISTLAEPQIRYQRSSRLRDQGIQLHYPSVIVSDDHRVAGPPIAGFKTRTGYVTLLSDLLKLKWTEEFQVAEHVALPLRMNPFFKPLYGTDFIVSGNAARGNYIFNVKTAATFGIPWSGDPGPSPDGEFVTILDSSGLYWFAISEILSGNTRDLIFFDPGLRTYQSVGQLSSSTYRVLGALSSSTNPAGLLARDFESKRQEGGGKTLTPLSEWRSVCDGKRIAIPMLSKSGHLLAGSYQGTLRVFRVGVDAAGCEEIFDTQSVSGKADFSRDDRFLTYVTRSENPRTGTAVDTIILADLSTNSTKPIYFAESGIQLAFPAFMNPDCIVVYDQTSQELITIELTRIVE